MSVTLKREPSASNIHISNMKDGQIAEIMSWSSGEYIGRIVQRVGPTLITIGCGCGNIWEDVFQEKYIGGCPSEDIVRLLLPGETIVIEQN